MKVKTLPYDPGPAGWNVLLPEPPAVQELGEDQSTDWLIIGAGFAGLAAARRLAQLCPTDRIVILDAKRVGEGPAGRNSGFMIDLPHDLASDDYGGAVDHDIAQTMDNRFAIAFAAEMAREFGLPDEAFQPVGKINGAASSKGHQHNLDYAKHLEHMGEAFEIYSAAKMKAITGTDYYQSGLFTPGTAMIQPAMFVRGVAGGLASNRVRIFENSPVVELTRDGDWVAKTPKGRIRAPKVILAVNGHVQSFGYPKGRLMHVHTYASMTRALSASEISRLGGQDTWNITPADPLGTTVRRVSGAGRVRLVVRNTFTFDPDMKPPKSWLRRITRDHDSSFIARFPMLQGVAMEYRWGGRLCLSFNNVQVVDELQPGLYSAACQNGLGTVRGTLAGILAAELATGTVTDRLARAMATPGPTRLPPGPIAAIGARARLRYGEWRAGLEF